MDIVRRKLILVTIGTKRVKQMNVWTVPKKVAVVERWALLEF